MDDLVRWLRQQIADEKRRAHRPSEIALCEAHTAILDRYEFVINHGPALGDVRALDMTIGSASALADVVRMVGLAYQHHSGYRAEWRPDRQEGEE